MQLTLEWVIVDDRKSKSTTVGPHLPVNTAESNIPAKRKMVLDAVLLDSITGALGAPFLLEDPSNQFLHLKRHIYLQDYWNPDHSPNTWGNTLADQAHETWTALKTTAQYYLNVNTFTLDMSTAQ
nr:uncharacterized protein C3orf85 homolog [Kogia breviceps]